MRRAKEWMTWIAVIATVWAVFYAAAAPEIDANLGVPACVSLPNHTVCRYCADGRWTKLPKEIDGQNVRCVVSRIVLPQVVAQQ